MRKCLPTEANSECRRSIPWQSDGGGKLHRREGNSPDRRLRPPSWGSVYSKAVGSRRQPEGGLRSSHPFKSAYMLTGRVTLRQRYTGLSPAPKPRALLEGLIHRRGRRGRRGKLSLRAQRSNLQCPTWRLLRRRLRPPPRNDRPRFCAGPRFRDPGVLAVTEELCALCALCGEFGS